MKLLLITFDYSPGISPRSFRWTGLAEYWAEQGHEVYVLTAHFADLPESETLRNVQVIRTTSALTRKWRNQHAVRNGRCDSSPSWKSKAAKFVYRHKLLWPDRTGIWYFAAVKKAEELMRTHRMEHVVTSSYPFTDHLVGFSLKRKFPEIRWLIDFGDPFSFLEDEHSNNQFLYRHFNYWFENRILGYCDAVTVATEQTKHKYFELFPGARNKIRVIPALFQEIPLLECGKQNSGRRIMTYAGTLYPSIRNPDRMLELFATLIKTPGYDDLDLHIYGQHQDCRKSFEPYVQLVGKRIFIHGIVPLPETRFALSLSDFVIHIGNNLSYQLPSKVVECVAVTRPILNFVSRRDDHSLSFFEDHPAIHNVFEDEFPLSDVRVKELQKFLASPHCIPASWVESKLEPHRTEALAKKYLQALGVEPQSPQDHECLPDLVK